MYTSMYPDVLLNCVRVGHAAGVKSYPVIYWLLFGMGIVLLMLAIRGESIKHMTDGQTRPNVRSVGSVHHVHVVSYDVGIMGIVISHDAVMASTVGPSQVDL